MLELWHAQRHFWSVYLLTLAKVGALKTTIPYDQLVTNEFLPR